MLSFPAGTALKTDVRGPVIRAGEATEPGPAEETLPAPSGTSGFREVLAALGEGVTPPPVLPVRDPSAPVIAPDVPPDEDAQPEGMPRIEGESAAPDGAGDRLPPASPHRVAVFAPSAGAVAFLPEGAARSRPPDHSPARHVANEEPARAPEVPGLALPGAEGPPVRARRGDPRPDTPGPGGAGAAGGAEGRRQASAIGTEAPAPDARIAARTLQGISAGPVPAERGAQRAVGDDGNARRGGARSPTPTGAHPIPPGGADLPPGLLSDDRGGRVPVLSPDRPVPDATGVPRAAPDPALQPADASARPAPPADPAPAAPARMAPPPADGRIAPATDDMIAADARTDPLTGVLADPGRVMREALAPSAASSAPAETARTVMRQIMASVRDAGAGSFEIRLDPEELGKLRIVLRPGDAGLAVSITAERPETLDLLRRHAVSLAQDFRALGYEGAAFSFGPGGGGPDPRTPGRAAAGGAPVAGDLPDRRDNTHATPARDTAPPARGRMDVRF